MDNIVQIRTKEIRKATPNCLEELFEMQNRICDLCGQPIQDLILAQLDHSVPVIRYARAWDVAIEDAVRECNRPSNLRAVHSSCNHKKSNLTREEWFKKGLDKGAEKYKIFTKEQLNFFKFQLGLGGRIGGKKGGIKAVKNKTGIHSPEFDRSANGFKIKERQIGIFAPGYLQKGIGGRRRFEIHGSFATQESRSKGGVIQGQRNIESGHWASLQTQEIRILGGKAAGKKAAESGQINTIKTYESSLKGALNQKVEDKSRGGQTQGRKNVASGHLERIRHIKNHLKKNKFFDTCKFCAQKEEV